MQVGMLYSRVRVEEKLLLEELQQQGASVDWIDVRSVILDIGNPEPWKKYDAIFDRCLSHSQSLALATVLESWGINVINSAEVNRVCGDKIETSTRLVAAGVPTIPVQIAVADASALQAIESVGYPAVLKPTVGSWGRLLAKVNDRDSAESIIEHKAALGIAHSLFYVQPFIEKGGMDIRTFVIGDKAICGIQRHSEHWITNTARGAVAEKCEMTDEVCEISENAARAVGGGMVAVDLFRNPDGSFCVNEINASMEFRNSSQPTGVNIPGKMAEYVVAAAAKGGIR